MQDLLFNADKIEWFVVFNLRSANNWKVISYGKSV